MMIGVALPAGVEPTVNAVDEYVALAHCPKHVVG